MGLESPLDAVPTPPKRSLGQSTLVFDNPRSGARNSHEIGDCQRFYVQKSELPIRKNPTTSHLIQSIQSAQIAQISTEIIKAQI